MGSICVCIQQRSTTSANNTPEAHAVATSSRTTTNALCDVPSISRLSTDRTEPRTSVVTVDIIDENMQYPGHSNARPMLAAERAPSHSPASSRDSISKSNVALVAGSTVPNSADAVRPLSALAPGHNKMQSYEPLAVASSYSLTITKSGLSGSHSALSLVSGGGDHSEFKEFRPATPRVTQTQPQQKGAEAEEEEEEEEEAAHTIWASKLKEATLHDTSSPSTSTPPSEDDSDSVSDDLSEPPPSPPKLQQFVHSNRNWPRQFQRVPHAQPVPIQEEEDDDDDHALMVPSRHSATADSTSATATSIPNFMTLRSGTTGTAASSATIDEFTHLQRKLNRCATFALQPNRSSSMQSQHSSQASILRTQPSMQVVGTAHSLPPALSFHSLSKSPSAHANLLHLSSFPIVTAIDRALSSPGAGAMATPNRSDDGMVLLQIEQSKSISKSSTTASSPLQRNSNNSDLTQLLRVDANNTLDVDPAELVQKRVVFVSLMQLHRSYQKGIPPFVLKHAVFVFAGCRGWLFPSNAQERTESETTYIAHFRAGFPPKFVDMIRSKDEQGLVLWVRPCASERARACWTDISAQLQKIVDLSVPMRDVMLRRQKLQPAALSNESVRTDTTLHSDFDEKEATTMLTTRSTTHDLEPQPASFHPFVANLSSNTAPSNLPTFSSSSYRFISNYSSNLSSSNNTSLQPPSTTETTTMTAMTASETTANPAAEMNINNQQQKPQVMTAANDEAIDEANDEGNVVYLEDMEDMSESAQDAPLDDDDDEFNVDIEDLGQDAHPMAQDQSRPSTQNVFDIDDQKLDANRAKNQRRDWKQKMAHMAGVDSELQEFQDQEKQYTIKVNSKSNLMENAFAAHGLHAVPAAVTSSSQYLPYYNGLRLDKSWWMHQYEPRRMQQTQEQKLHLAHSARILDRNQQHPSNAVGAPHPLHDIRSRFNVEAAEVWTQITCIERERDINIRTLKELFYQSNPSLIPMDFFELRDYMEAHLDADQQWIDIYLYCERTLADNSSDASQVTPSNTDNTHASAAAVAMDKRVSTSSLGSSLQTAMDGFTVLDNVSNKTMSIPSRLSNATNRSLSPANLNVIQEVNVESNTVFVGDYDDEQLPFLTGENSSYIFFDD